MTDILYDLIPKLLQGLKNKYPYVQNETRLSNALRIIREREGVTDDFSEEYAEIEKYESECLGQLRESPKSWRRD